MLGWGCGWYRPYYYPGYISSYYYGSVLPGGQTSAYAGPSVIAPVVVDPEPPRFGVGVFAGGMTSTDFNTANNVSETDLDVLARFQLDAAASWSKARSARESDSIAVNDRTTFVSTPHKLRRQRCSTRFGARKRAPRHAARPSRVSASSSTNTDGSYNTTMRLTPRSRSGLQFALTPHIRVRPPRGASRSTVSGDSSGTTGTHDQSRRPSSGQRPAARTLRAAASPRSSTSDRQVLGRSQCKGRPMTRPVSPAVRVPLGP